jgi:hypothetical protein
MGHLPKGKLGRIDIEKVPLVHITKWVLLAMVGGRNGLCCLLTNSTSKKQSRLAEIATTIIMPGIRDGVTLDQAMTFSVFLQHSKLRHAIWNRCHTESADDIRVIENWRCSSVEMPMTSMAGVHNNKECRQVLMSHS